VTFFQCNLLRDITVARIFWLSQSEERKPKKWPSMIRNVSLVNGQTDRLALPYRVRPPSLSPSSGISRPFLFLFSHPRLARESKRVTSNSGREKSTPPMHAASTAAMHTLCVFHGRLL
jgi:hypothetical protein